MKLMRNIKMSNRSAAEHMALKQVKRDRQAIVAHLHAVLQQAAMVFDFETYPTDRDVLLQAAVKILDRLSWELPAFTINLSCPLKDNWTCI